MPSRSTAQVIVVSDDGGVAPWRDRWDALATQAQRPYMTPAWTIAWWRHLRPRDAVLRVMLVVDGDDLLGVTPLYVRPRRWPTTYRMLGLPYDAPKEPLARPGDEAIVAAALADALVDAEPHADALELPGLPLDAGWHDLLRTSDRGAHLYSSAPRSVPTVPIADGTFEAWFGSKSRNFRQQMRRAGRRLEEAGGRLTQTTTADELAARIPTLIDLHEERWRDRGGSSVVRPGLTEMLRDATADLGVPDRARLWCVEAEDRVVSAHLFVASGGRSSYWLGGFDPEWGAYHPGMLCLLAEIEHAFGAGLSLVDLGAGGHAYKQRLAEDEELIGRATFVFKGRGYAWRRVVTGPAELVETVGSRTPESWKQAVRDAQQRLGIGGGGNRSTEG